MVVLVKQGTDDVKLQRLIAQLQSYGVQVHPVKGTQTTILGLIGDTSAFVSLKRMPLEDIQATMKSGKFQAALVPFKPDSDSAYDMLSAFTSDSPKNIIGYADIDYNSLIALASSSPEKQAGDYLKQAEQKLIDDAVLIPFAYQTSFYALSKRSKDIVITPFGGRLLFKYAQKVKKK